MLLKGVALWLPSCKQGDKQREGEEEGGAGASASLPSPPWEEVRTPENASSFRG